MRSGVYKITNLINKKVYIGVSENLKRRLYSHIVQLKRGTHPIFNDEFCINNENFQFEILEYTSVEMLSKRETYYIDLYEACNPDKGYNKKREMPWTKRKPKPSSIPVTEIVPYLTARDIFNQFGFNSQNLKELMKKGLPFHRFVGCIRFDRVEVEKWLSKHTQN
jgi:hypothetical protein